MTEVEDGITAPEGSLSGFEHIKRYWDKEYGCYAAKIFPGEFYVTVRAEAITTVLGSCVSACIWDAGAGVGGMNHFMLPHDTDGNGSWGDIDALRNSTCYGTYAMEQLINEVLKAGGRRKHLRTKVFGGGKIISEMTDIGERNITFVQQYIETEGLTLVAQDLGDVYPRNVVFFPLEGRARVKKLKSLHRGTVAAREEAYLTELERRPVQGEVELF